MEKVMSVKADKYFFISRWFTKKTEQTDLEQYDNFMQVLAPKPDEPLFLFQKIIKEWLEQKDIGLELSREYTKLFVLPDGVKPYESVYCGEEIRLMQESWVEVKNYYKKIGWQMENSVFPEDHISVELSFMGHLIAAGRDQDAADFFRLHIINWAPDLMKDIINHQNANYYQKVAEYGLAFIQAEALLH